MALASRRNHQRQGGIDDAQNSRESPHTLRIVFKHQQHEGLALKKAKEEGIADPAPSGQVPLFFWVHGQSIPDRVSEGKLWVSRSDDNWASPVSPLPSSGWKA